MYLVYTSIGRIFILGDIIVWCADGIFLERRGLQSIVYFCTILSWIFVLIYYYLVLHIPYILLVFCRWCLSSLISVDHRNRSINMDVSLLFAVCATVLCCS